MLLQSDCSDSVPMSVDFSQLENQPSIGKTGCYIFLMSCVEARGAEVKFGTEADALRFRTKRRRIALLLRCRVSYRCEWRQACIRIAAGRERERVDAPVVDQLIVTVEYLYLILRPSCHCGINDEILAQVAIHHGRRPCSVGVVLHSMYAVLQVSD